MSRAAPCSPSVSRRSFLGAALGLMATPLLPRGVLAAPAEQAFEPYWVQNHTETELWSGPDARATRFTRVKPFSYFKVLQPQRAPRLYVLDPLTEGTAWIAAAAVGPSGEPPESYFLKEPVAVGKLNLPGRIAGGANVRSRPEIAPDTLVGRLGHNTGVSVLDEVKGADGETWYRVEDGQYVHHSLVRLPKPFPTHPGKVIVAELAEPTLVTAYEDGKPAYAAMALKGTVGWGTPTGFFKILRRVENETMDSATLGIPRSGPGGYYLRNVLYTQYFTGDGASIHYNWWSGNFGYSGSHGCLGMNLEDARWFWEWAGVGTPLFIRE
jgi:lipoprotein-anchoring transpeptidase ErfK/SrfK